MSIAFRALGAEATADNGDLTPALPLGWQPGDILYCLVAAEDNISITMPGWDTLAGANNGASLRLSLFWHRADEGDSAPLVSHAGGGPIRAVVIAYSGGSEESSPNIVGAPALSSSASLEFGSGITTPEPHYLCLELGAIAVLGAQGPTILTYSGSPTERLHSSEFSTWPELCIAEFPMTAAGSTGARSATLSEAAVSIGLLLALKSTVVNDPDALRARASRLKGFRARPTRL